MLVVIHSFLQFSLTKEKNGRRERAHPLLPPFFPCTKGMRKSEEETDIS
jgi:hypothetical protein